MTKLPKTKAPFSRYNRDMDIWSTAAAVALGYLVGRVCYDMLHSTPWKGSGGKFLDEMKKSQSDKDKDHV